MERIKTDLTRLGALWLRVLTASALTVLVVGCASSDDLVADKDLMAVPVGAVGHYGWGIGVPEYYINDQWMGNVSGWGGGGAGMCCVLLPKYPKGPFMVKVRWTSCDIGHIKFVNDRVVDPAARCIEANHEATVPVHFALPPGQGGDGLFVHFLPGHSVEVWFAGQLPPGKGYPGPSYPEGPAPRYAPLPGEKAQPSQAKNQ